MSRYEVHAGGILSLADIPDSAREQETLARRNYLYGQRYEVRRVPRHILPGQGVESMGRTFTAAAAKAVAADLSIRSNGSVTYDWQQVDPTTSDPRNR